MICLEWESCCLKGRQDERDGAWEPVSTFSREVFHGWFFNSKPKVDFILLILFFNRVFPQTASGLPMDCIILSLKTSLKRQPHRSRNEDPS